MSADGRIPRRERSRQLLDIALEIVVGDGYDALTMAAVARIAGVSKPIVYRSYPNRAALIVALLRREQNRMDEILDRILPPDPPDRHPREVLTGAVREMVEAAERDPARWRLVLLPPEGTPNLVAEMIRRRREALIRRARALTRWGLLYLRGGEGIDVDILARFLVAIVEEQARMVLTDSGPDREIVIASNEALLEGLDWRERAA